MISKLNSKSPVLGLNTIRNFSLLFRGADEFGDPDTVESDDTKVDALTAIGFRKS